MKNKFLSIEEKYYRLKKRFIIVCLLCGGLFLGTAYYTYLNFDYLLFKHMISQQYIYTETLDDLYQQYLALDTQGKYYTYFDNLVIQIVTEKIQETNGDVYTYQYTPNQYAQYKSREAETAAKSAIEIYDADTVVLKIANFSKYTLKFIQENQEILNQYKNIIIDLRGNGGGRIDAMYKIEDLFLTDKLLLSYENTRFRLFTKEVYSKTTKHMSFENIIILQDKNTASASEGFICALRDHLDNVTVIGETSFGKGIGQITLPLTKGYYMKATVFYWLSPDGYNIHRIGIEPDIFYDHEDILDFAIQSLNTIAQEPTASQVQQLE